MDYKKKLRLQEEFDQLDVQKQGLISVEDIFPDDVYYLSVHESFWAADGGGLSG